MPLKASQFIAPLGNLRREMFPKEDLPTRLDLYLAEAYTKVGDLPDPVDEDAMVTAFVYHKAYSALHAAMLAAPSNTTLADQGSVSWSAEQMKEIGRLAQSYQEQVEGFFVVVEPPPRIQQSAAARTRTVW